MNNKSFKRTSKNLYFVFILLPSLLLLGCFEDLDDNVVATTNINDFVWKGMNAVYLYKSEIPDLANDRFSTDEEYTSYLNDFENPELLFESVKYLPNEVDRFSRIFDNYFDFLNQQQGNTISDGLEFYLDLVPGSDTEVYGAITLVLNNSVADDLGLQRGQIFRAVNGVNLTVNNFANLLNDSSYTLNFANYDTNATVSTADDTVVLNGESVTVTKTTYTENPVHRSLVLDISNTKIGYLMYNSFNSNFHNSLNAVFADFANQGVTELVLDLRYNGGGSIQTATYLASMVTGQFNGEIFSKLFYNENLQDNNRDFLFTNTIEGLGAINSLGLTKVYVLTTNARTASASELIINSLKPYIDVVVVGEPTVGKTQASQLIYDSPTLFSSANADPTHSYAMLPLIANSVNVNDQLVSGTGLLPDILVSEVAYDLGTLGDANEPLLNAAIADITGIADRPAQQNDWSKNRVDISELLPPLDQLMIIE